MASARFLVLSELQSPRRKEGVVGSKTTRSSCFMAPAQQKLEKSTSLETPSVSTKFSQLPTQLPSGTPPGMVEYSACRPSIVKGKSTASVPVGPKVMSTVQPLESNSTSIRSGPFPPLIADRSPVRAMLSICSSAGSWATAIESPVTESSERRAG